MVPEEVAIAYLVPIYLVNSASNRVTDSSSNNFPFTITESALLATRPEKYTFPLGILIKMGRPPYSNLVRDGKFYK